MGSNKVVMVLTGDEHKTELLKIGQSGWADILGVYRVRDFGPVQLCFETLGAALKWMRTHGEAEHIAGKPLLKRKGAK